jgi:hypothetical protein
MQNEDELNMGLKMEKKPVEPTDPKKGKLVRQGKMNPKQ